MNSIIDPEEDANLLNSLGIDVSKSSRNDTTLQTTQL
jgi:hypothetical protein